MASILTIDSGNTSIKWGLHDRHSWVSQGTIHQDKISLLAQSWQNLPEPSFIIISNVAGDVAHKNLSYLCSKWQIKPFWVTAVRQQCGVRNLYVNPLQLGSDRWAALVAAWNHQQQATLVINIGTAMTLDMLSESGDFLGGVILPGPELMFNVLKTHTAIPCVAPGHFSQWPICTADAIYSGVIHSLLGAIERMQQVLKKRLGRSVPNCILSGGAVSFILPYLDVPFKVIDNLVLEGLYLIAQDRLKYINSTEE